MRVDENISKEIQSLGICIEEGRKQLLEARQILSQAERNRAAALESIEQIEADISNAHDELKGLVNAKGFIEH